MKLKFDRFSTHLLLLMAMLLMGTAVYSQRTISGVVLDAETGEPLIGANILVIGTATGTATGIDGDYSLDVPEGATQLEFSYTGYNAQVVEIGSRTEINIEMTAGQILDEVVVIGYGTTTKKDKTGALTSVDSENFNRGAVTSPDQLITGKVAGVQITANNGAPGSNSKIRIRGGTSITAGNEPLYVIDGVPIDNSGFNPGGFSEGKNPLNTINPSDIETITVLKDASATAIYGSRAANGVIIITTKTGSAGDRNSISYDGNVIISQAIATPNILSPSEFRSVVAEVTPDRVDDLGEANTTWFDEILQTGIGQNHTLAFSGGTKNTGYRLSLGYQNIDGIIKTSNTERLSAAVNLNSNFFDDHLKVTTSLKVAFTRDQFNDGGAIGNAASFDPTRPVLDADSPYGGYWEWDVALGTKNPVALLDLTNDFGRAFRGLGNVQFDYKFHFLEGMSAVLNLGFDVNNGLRERYQPTTLRSQADNGASLRNENYSVVSPLLEAYLKYEKELPGINSRLDLLGGYSYQQWEKDYFTQIGDNIETNFLGLNGVPTEDIRLQINRLANNLISYFGRVNYYLLDKYQVTATIRRDGSSRFGPSNRWGIFPSGAVAWRLIDESFMEGAKNIFSDLKVRVSYGITGSQEIEDYRFLPTYTFSDANAGYIFGNEFIITTRSNGADSNIKWEETATLNVGLDYGFANGRFSGAIEWYQKKTSDLLFEVGVPAGVIPINRVISNIGSVENTGIEFSLNAVAIDKENFDWNLSANFSYNQNEITGLDRQAEDPEFIGYLDGDISGGVGNKIRLLRVGIPVNTFYVYEHILGPDGLPLVDGVDHNEDGAVNLADIYVDQNEDGIVNDQDLRTYFNGNPDYLFGLTSNMYYKNFDFSFTLRGSIGNYVYNNNSSSAGNYARIVSGIGGVLENMNSSVLETNFQEEQLFSDYYIENGSFARLDNITLGYTLNNLFGDGGNLRVYATGQNLFLVTGYSGLDPEVFGGIDNNIYPRAQTFLLGVNLNF